MDLFRRKTAPPPKEAAAKGMFKARATQDLQTVTIKLAAVEAEIATAEAELSKVSLAAVLSDDQASGFQAVSSLNELRSQRELLQHALSAAQQAENARLADLHSKADKARDRARAQHLASVERETVSLTNNLIAVRDSFRRLVQAADGVRANLPKSLVGHLRDGIEGQLSADQLRFLADVSAYGMSQDGIPAPGCTRAPPNAHTIDGWSGDWPGLIELVSSRVVQPIKRLSEPAALPPLEIAVASTTADAPALAELQPSVGGGGAAVQDELGKGGEGIAHMPSSPSTRSPALTGVSINSRGGIEDLTSRISAPAPYEAVDEPDGEEAIAGAPEELVAPAGSRAAAFNAVMESY